jgi:hypothetical protein
VFSSKTAIKSSLTQATHYIKNKYQISRSNITLRLLINNKSPPLDHKDIVDVQMFDLPKVHAGSIGNDHASIVDYAVNHAQETVWHGRRWQDLSDSEEEFEDKDDDKSLKYDSDCDNLAESETGSLENILEAE